ncbi:unnamed protein product, partial [Gulo gulo]
TTPPEQTSTNQAGEKRSPTTTSTPSPPLQQREQKGLSGVGIQPGTHLLPKWRNVNQDTVLCGRFFLPRLVLHT